MIASDAATAPLTSAGTITLGSTSILDLAGSGTTAGIYRLITGSSLSGTFGSFTGLSGYQLVYTGTSVNAQQKGVFGAVSATTGALAIITGGSTGISYTVANTALSGGASLAFSSSNTANVSGTSGGSAAATATSSSVTGLFFTGVTTGAAQAGLFSVGAPDATSSPQTGSVTVDVYGHASPTLAGGTISLGNLHIGYGSPVTGSLSAGNAAGYRVAMNGSAAAVGNLALSSLSGIAPGSSGIVTGTLATGQSAGTISQLLTYTFADSSSLNGASANVGTAGILMSGLVYSGTATWATNGGGSWGTLSGTGGNAFGGNWGTSQGSPGLDASFADTDTATFGSALSGGTATIFLNGASPSLKAVTFDNAAGSYQIFPSNGSGPLTLLGSGTAAATVTAARGSHGIYTDVTLGSLTSVDVASGAALTFHSAVGGTGLLQKLGTGVLTLEGANTFSGDTQLNGGTLLVNGSLASGVLISSGTLGGSGVMQAMLAGVGLVSPGNSPGILTAGQFDPTGGLATAFEFTTSTPNFAVSGTGALNDVLRLTNANPFNNSSLTSANAVDVYFDVTSLIVGDTFEGGFFTTQSPADLLASIQNASYTFWVKSSGAGTTTFNGVNYDPVTSVPGVTGVEVATAPKTNTDFGAGGVVTSGSDVKFIVVPEPVPSVLAIGLLGAAAWLYQRRLRA